MFQQKINFHQFRLYNILFYYAQMIEFLIFIFLFITNFLFNSFESSLIFYIYFIYKKLFQLYYFVYFSAY